mgnify:CR=1 FL=1
MTLCATLCLNIWYRKLAGYTIFITGASRGIGKSIALKAAKDGANIVIAAKTAEPHPKLPGTVYTAAKESNYKDYKKRNQTVVLD